MKKGKGESVTMPCDSMGRELKSHINLNINFLWWSLRILLFTTDYTDYTDFNYNIEKI